MSAGGVENVLRSEGTSRLGRARRRTRWRTERTDRSRLARGVDRHVDSAEVPPVAVERVRNLALDSLGNQFAGMSVSTGRLLSEWVRGQGAAPVCTVTAQDFKTTPAFATLVNGAASPRSRTTTSRPSAATPTARSPRPRWRSGRSSGQPVANSFAWLVGWEITAQTMKVCSARGATSSSTAARSIKASRKPWASPRSRRGC